MVLAALKFRHSHYFKAFTLGRMRKSAQNARLNYCRLSRAELLCWRLSPKIGTSRDIRFRHRWELKSNGGSATRFGAEGKRMGSYGPSAEHCLPAVGR